MRPTLSALSVALITGLFAAAAIGLPPPDFVPPAPREGEAKPAGALAFAPGQWELTHEASGGPAARGPQTRTVCFDAEALKADPAAPLKQPPPASGGRRSGPSCSFGAVQVSGAQFAMPGRCEGPMGGASVDWSGTHAAESFEMAGQMRMGPMSMTMKVAGRRAGECPAE
jgi:hypothetical protein